MIFTTKENYLGYYPYIYGLVKVPLGEFLIYLIQEEVRLSWNCLLLCPILLCWDWSHHQITLKVILKLVIPNLSKWVTFCVLQSFSSVKSWYWSDVLINHSNTKRRNCKRKNVQNRIYRSIFCGKDLSVRWGGKMGREQSKTYWNLMKSKGNSFKFLEDNQ